MPCQLVLNARGTRLVTSSGTLAALALQGTFFGALLEAQGHGEEEVFLDHDPEAVRDLLDAFGHMRFGTAEALGALPKPSRPQALRPLLHFLGLEWMMGLHFPSRFDEPSKCQIGYRERCASQNELPDIVQHLVESSARASWAQLKQIALVDEQVELYGSGDEAFLMEQGGFVPLGEARFLDPPAVVIDSERQRYWPTSQQSRLILDLGEGNAVWPTGFSFQLTMPDGQTSSEPQLLALQLEGLSELQKEVQLLAACRLELPGRARDAPGGVVELPLTPQRQSAYRMLRLSATMQDKRVGCSGLRVYGDLFQEIPKELLIYPRETHMFSPSYTGYDRVGQGKTPYHGSAGFYQEWI